MSKDAKKIDGGAEGKPNLIVAEDEKLWRKEYRANVAKLRKQLRGEHKHNWDYGYILEYLRLKLRCMRSHFTRPDINICDNSFVNQIDEALAAIDRYLSDDYFDKALAFEALHTKVTYFDPEGKSTEIATLSYEEQSTFELDPDTKSRIDKYGLHAFRTDWDDDDNIGKWSDMMAEADDAKQADLHLFFDILADHIEEWWD